MRLTWETVTLTLGTTFRTAHGASALRRNVVVRLEHEGSVGLGEAAGLSYHGESPEGIEAALQQAARSLRGVGLDPADGPSPILDRLQTRMTSEAARAAVDIALHDLWGQRRGQALWRLLGLDRRSPDTSFTIGLDSPSAMARRAREAGMPILKLKLGGRGEEEQDEAVVAAVRAAAPAAAIRVDANAGWTREQAARLIPRLVGAHDLELVEQPLPADDIEGLRWLRGRGLGVPIFADESAATASQVEALAGAVDGVVVKLMKAGGLLGARRAIAAARAGGMQVMLGCMIESSLGVTAAAHLAPLCDLVDLDGPLLIADDPFCGLTYDGARLELPDAPGLGVTAR